MSNPSCYMLAKTLVSCPLRCKENAWHHHHDQDGTLWTCPGSICSSTLARCGARIPSQDPRISFECGLAPGHDGEHRDVLPGAWS